MQVYAILVSYQSYQASSLQSCKLVASKSFRLMDSYPRQVTLYPPLTLLPKSWPPPWPHLDPLKINENTSVFITFPSGDHLAPPRRLQWDNGASSKPPGGISKPPGVPSRSPRVPQKVPKSLQQVPKSLQQVPKSLQQVPKSLQKVPKSTQKVPQSLKKVPQRLQKVPKILQKLSKSFQNASKSLQKVPRLSRRLPTATVNW